MLFQANAIEKIIQPSSAFELLAKSCALPSRCYCVMANTRSEQITDVAIINLNKRGQTGNINSLMSYSMIDNKSALIPKKA